MGDVAAQMAAQREAAPVFWYEAPSLEHGFWVLSTWEHCRFVGSRPDLFSSRYGFAIGDASRITPAVLRQLPAWTREALAGRDVTAPQRRGLVARGKLSMGDPELENMMFLDPPRHGDVRRIFMKALRPSLVRSLKPRMVEIADELIDELVTPGEEVDFVTTVGRVPAALMTEMVGVPRSMREEFIEMATAHMQAITITPDADSADAERIRRLEDKFRAYVDELVAERRGGISDGDDLVSVIARSELDGQPVPRALASVFVTHFVAAGETTRGLLSHLILALGRRPQQRRLLFDHPELLPNALEETMRYYPINWSGCRTATQRVEIGGQVIEPGDFVVMAYAAANRDPDIYERPEEYDITRAPERDHLGFGHGEHSCPGALLARTDARAVGDRLLQRFRDWELAADPTTWATPFLRGVSRLPVRFHP
jgi:cytochrome P450